MDQLIDITCVPIKLEFETQPIRVEYEEVSKVNLDIEVEKGGLEIKHNIPNVDTIEISKGPHVTPICTAKKGMIGEDENVLFKKHENFPTIKIDNNKTKLNDLGIHYESDEIKISAENQVEKKVIPGSIEYSVVQYPDVIIDFIGDMLYVPPSSNPNYEENN